MRFKMKASCWCCDTCMNLRRQRLHEREDSQDVFLPLNSKSQSSQTENRTQELNTGALLSSGKSALDSGIRSATSEIEIRDVDMDSESAVFNDNDYGGEDELLDPSDGLYDSLPLNHLYVAMNYHPQYFASFLDAHHYLMRGIGPLPFDQRCYIGILAASRHHCSYLVKSLAAAFVVSGGDAKWLAGLDHIPKKLRNLCEVNRILAHRPWLLTKQHIEKLTKGADNWSISELTQALVLLAHFHSLSSFVFACGITLDTDEQKRVHTSVSNGHHGSFDNSSSDSDVEIELILERMKLLSEETGSGMTQEELRKRFDKIESQATKLTTKKKKVPTATLR